VRKPDKTVPTVARAAAVAFADVAGDPMATAAPAMSMSSDMAAAVRLA
jgi:hypothetical protein